MAEPVKPDSEGHTIVSEESELHERVQARVSAQPAEAGNEFGAEDLDKDLIALRDAIAEAKPEDLAPLVEQMTRIAAIRSRMGRSKSLPVDIQSPYFAHMILKEGDKSRDVLVGKRGFIDRKSNVQIVDWRNAPVSQIYYRYDEGDDYDEEIAGRMLTGWVTTRRNVSIMGSKLRRIGAPQGTFVRDLKGKWRQAMGDLRPTLQGGQGTAVRAPARSIRHDAAAKQKAASSSLGVHGQGMFRSEKHLPEIAALIDREQFELITKPEGGMVVIQGGAGSGKTTVALHRIAYLAFADKQRFRSSRILFVVPNDALVRYVASVLPSLGVTGVPVQTYATWAKNTRLKLLKGSKSQYNADTPDGVSRVKKHPGLLSVLGRYVDDQCADFDSKIRKLLGQDPSAPARALIESWSKDTKSALVPRLRRLYRAVQSSKLPSSLRIAAEGLITTLGRRASDVITDWSYILTDAARLAEFIDLGPSDIEESVSWTSGQIEDAPVKDDTIEYADGGQDEVTTAGRFDIEDDPILLRLIQLKHGELTSRYVNEPITYAHIAIDEAQDRSTLEVKVLVEATLPLANEASRRSVTIAGDTAQRIVFDNAFTGWSELLEQIGFSSVEVSPLKLSYRSTAEVMALARDILGPDLMPEDPLFARSGAPVELHQFGDVGEAVAFLSDAMRGLLTREPSASVALLARYPEQADIYHAGLMRAEVPNLRRVRSQEFTFRAGVDVTDVSQVKGLEFDYVIMVDVNATSYPDTVESRHLLHIAATRAAHQLWLISTDLPCKLLPSDMLDGL